MNNKIALQLIFLLSMGMTIKAQHQVISLWPSTPPENKGVNVEEERPDPGLGSKVLTKVTIPELWWFQAQTKQPAPAVIICPGGGYGVEAYEHEGTQVAQWLASLGYHAFVLKYRLPDESLVENATFVPLMDARQAIYYIRKESEKWNVDPGQIGIMGFSAGGHLAGSAATLFDEPVANVPNGVTVRPDFSILIYPVISMRDSLTHGGSKKALLGENPDPELVALFSLEERVTPNTPPTFILHASDDEGVLPDNTRQYAAALRKHSVPVKEIILPEGGHGFGFRKESPAFVWTDLLEEWLKEDQASGNRQ